MSKVICFTLMMLFFSTTAFTQSLHLYGGRNHDVYLGCLNCDKYNSASIWNAYGTYGSKYNANSIWNAYGEFGSGYSSYSPWNAYSNDPPVVVDNQGNFYGYFTVNGYKGNRADFGLALTIYEYHDFIKDDVAKWYDKIFR